ncbi:MAG: ABC transporter permease DevC [Pseudomonadota bacterium]
MTALLGYVLGRLPIGWLQLTHNKNRLAAALAGVAFANVLIFVQLGFLGALVDSAVMPYKMIKADVLIYASDTNTLSDSGTLPRQRMFEALAFDEVASATPVYIGGLDWLRPDGGTSTLRVFGTDPGAMAFLPHEINSNRDRLKLQDVGLIDRKTRNMPMQVLETIDAGKIYSFEASGRNLHIQGTFDVGAGFDSDGFIIVSDQTFLNFFPRRTASAPNYIFVTLKPGVNAERFVQALRQKVPSVDTVVNTLATATDDDQRYQTQERPIGIIFGFGVVIGVLVGIVIVYQVLSTDVADHLSEYATFKAIGYKQSFFRSIVFEEAFVLALIGFVPGIVLSEIIYQLTAAGTGLPVAMTLSRALYVLGGTIVMCAASGAFATRRLAGANPADLF